MYRKFVNALWWLNFFAICQFADSCGTLRDRHMNVQPELRPYVEEFKKEALSRGFEIPKERFYLDIKETNGMNRGNIGVCSFNRTVLDFFSSDGWDGGHGTVIVRPKSYFVRPPFVTNPEVWELAYKTVIFHELGHCLLFLDHAEQEEKSIMRPYEEIIYPNEWNGLVDELFNRARLELP